MRRAPGAARARTLAVALAAALLAACAGDAPVRDQGFDDGAGRAKVEILGDGFCRLDGERMPFDAMVLRLRIRVRALAPADRLRFVVAVAPAKDVDVGARAGVQRELDRIVQQLNAMDVAQVEYL